MVGTDTYSAPGLVSLMQSWVGSGRASIMVQSSRLHLDQTCGTSLDTLQSSVCPLGEQPLLTSPSIGFTQMTSSPGSDSESAAQAGAIAGSISAVVVVILAIFSALLILVLAMKTLNSKQQVNYYLIIVGAAMQACCNLFFLNFIAQCHTESTILHCILVGHGVSPTHLLDVLILQNLHDVMVLPTAITRQIKVQKPIPEIQKIDMT